MTFRGPFQPKLFYDSVIMKGSEDRLQLSSDQGCKVSDEALDREPCSQSYLESQAFVARLGTCLEQLKNHHTKLFFLEHQHGNSEAEYKFVLSTMAHSAPMTENS